jgi:hypothetical protein
MSVLPDGRGGRCDGGGCRATAALPVGLRRLPGGHGDSTPTSITGWLFAGGRPKARHYCPRCVALYLPQAREGVLRSLTEAVVPERGEAR